MSTLPQVLRASWNDFVRECESLRPDLYRYCRHGVARLANYLYNPEVGAELALPWRSNGRDWCR